MIDIFSMKYFY